MAIPSYVGGTLDEDLNTFGDWFAKTNNLITDMGTKVVSAEANTTGASTTGNVAINGILSANTLVAVNDLRGGTVNGSDLLTISSNTTFTGESINANTNSIVIGGNNFIISANVTTTTGNTITYNSDDTNFNGTNVNFSADNITYDGIDVLFTANTITFSGTNLNIAANTSFTANTVNLNNVVINDTLTLAEGAQLIFSDLVFSSNVSFEELIANNATIENVSINGGTINATSITANTIAANTVSANTITAVDFNSTSDANLKDNVNTLTNSMDVINQINPVSFTWKDSGIGAYGVIAQEIEKVLPEIVSNNDGTKTVAYTQLIAFLIGAIQEQQKEIDHIKSLL